MVGCASSSLSGGLGPPSSTAELPTEIPVDMKDRLVLKDTPEPVPIPTPSPEPARKYRRRRKGKKAPLPKIVAIPAPAVVYPSRRPKTEAVWVGEKLTYEVTYFGVMAGNVHAGSAALQGDRRPQGLSFSRDRPDV